MLKNCSQATNYLKRNQRAFLGSFLETLKNHWHKGEKFTQILLKGLEWYRDQMPPTSPSEIALEKSPSYFVTPSVPKRGEKIIYL